ncbi:Uncharacterised protein [uncultured archaeon]|nr:Uncharacterised protein [uncultured archaeon]
MEESISDRLAKIKANREKPLEERPEGRWSNAKKYLKRAAYAGAAVALIGGAASLYLTKDFLTKRQNYPERNVLYRSSNVTYVAGNKDKSTGTRADRESVTKFYAGGGVESKVGTYLFEATRERRGDIDYYNLDNSQKIRIASSTQKPEKFQAGLRIGGSLNFREQFAEVVLGSNSKSPQNYVVYKTAPERGLTEIDIDVIDHPDKTREVINRLVERRTIPLGWFFGKETFRSGTSLEDYGKDPNNNQLAKELLDKIRKIDSSEATGGKEREDLVNEIRAIEEKMSKKTIYSTFEDGYLKILPQGGTVYLGENPGFFKRALHYWIGSRDEKRLRIDNQWDLWPGRYPGLSEFSFGSGDDTLYPFDKYNNGGYTLRDKFGDIAKITIGDFVLRYGQDILYSYYLDLNGDGKIDKNKELIGSVVCRTTHDERMEIEQLSGDSRLDQDTTFTINYSFMSPSKDTNQGKKLFRLCAAIENMIPDQVHRGNGKHSLLGLINDQRSDIMLFEDLNIQNLSRALTQESTLAAKHDIIRILTTTGRPYAEDLAREYGISDEFKDQFKSSPLLRERIQLGLLPWLMIYAGAGFGIYYGGKKGIGYLRNRKHEKSISERLEEIREVEEQ